MKRNFKNKLKMVDQTIEIVDNNSVIIANIPAIIVAHNLLKQYREDIEKALNIQVKIITGITKEKRTAKLALANIAVKVSKATAAYAHSINNELLFDEIYYSKSKLAQVADEILIAIAENIYATGTALASEIEDFGIDSNCLLALKDATTNFKSKKVEPKVARDARKECTRKLDILFPLTMDLLKNELDKLVDVLADEHDTFKTLYKEARNIIDYNGPHQKPPVMPGVGILLGNVTNSEDSSPIEDATINIEELSLSVQTDENGDYYFESVPAGIYTLKISAFSYITETVTEVEVLSGAEVTLDIALNSDEEV